jgi:citrate lyase beta subunit
MPGDDLRKITKATTLNVDCIGMDMEDGVAINRKKEARRTIAQALQTLDFGRSEKLVRINPIGSGLEADDLAAALPFHPDGIVVPKVETAADVRWVSSQIAVVEREQAWPEGSIGLSVLVETARGVLNLPEIAAADPRLQAVMFGAEDLVGDIGALRTPQAWEVFYARSAIVTAAAAFNLQALDMIFVDFHDTSGLVKEAEMGLNLGYSGKQIIHPNQVEPVQQAFTPNEAAIAQAKRLLEAYHHHQQQGKGVFALDGKMVEAPMIKAAERVMSRARAAGKA